MNLDIEAMRLKLLSVVSDIGGMAQNLEEAADWAKDGRGEEAKLSLEAVATGAEDALNGLRAVALKCTEITSREGAAS